MLTEKDSKILKKLKEQEKEEGTLPLLLEFYRKLLHIQSKAKKRIGIPKSSLSRKAISERIEHGLPLVSFDDLVHAFRPF